MTASPPPKMRRRLFKLCVFILCAIVLTLVVIWTFTSVSNWLHAHPSDIKGAIFGQDSRGTTTVREAWVEQVHPIGAGDMAIVLVLDPQPLFGQVAQVQVCGLQTLWGRKVPLVGCPLIWCDLGAADLDAVLSEGLPQALIDDLVSSAKKNNWTREVTAENADRRPIILPANKYFPRPPPQTAKATTTNPSSR